MAGPWPGLPAKGILAFFLESIFLGVLVFGRRKVSPGLYWLSSFLVFFGSHLSGLWIIMANSWMQTPDGFKMEGGRAVLTDFFRAALNHSTLVRFGHTIAAGWITGSLAAAAMAAWLILKNRSPQAAKLLLRTALPVFIIVSLLQLGLGHLHSVQVAQTQPEKMAAYEALWQTRAAAPFTVFGIPPIAVPGMLSFLIHFDTSASVKGLNEFPPRERPPVLLPFLSYHLMILMGLVFIGLALGNILQGIPLNSDGEFTGSFFTLLRPFPLAVGLLGLSTFLLHGTAYALLKTEGGLKARAKRLAGRLWWMEAGLFLLGLFMSFLYLPWAKNKILAWPAAAAFLLSLAGLKAALAWDKDRPAFLMTSLSWLSLWGLAGAVLYPALVRASEPGLSLTAANASSSPLTLRVMFIIALVGLPIVIASTIFLYKVFKGKVKPGKAGY